MQERKNRWDSDILKLVSLSDTAYTTSGQISFKLLASVFFSPDTLFSLRLHEALGIQHWQHSVQRMQTLKMLIFSSWMEHKQTSISLRYYICDAANRQQDSDPHADQQLTYNKRVTKMTLKCIRHIWAKAAYLFFNQRPCQVLWNGV